MATAAIGLGKSLIANKGFGMALTGISSIYANRAARSEAQMHEQNADSVLDASEYNAIVVKQNSQAAQQDLAFKKSVNLYNKSKLVDKYATELRANKIKYGYEKSKVRNRIGYGGTSSVLIDALEMEQFKQDVLETQSEESLSAFMQEGEFDRSVMVQKSAGDAQARNILHEGRIAYNQNKFKAEQTRAAGRMNMIGTFGSMIINNS